LGDKEMRGAMGVKTLEKSSKWKFNSWSFSVIFGRFWGILAGIIFYEKGRLLDGNRPEAGGWRLEDRRIYHEGHEGREGKSRWYVVGGRWK
jgi:hypothetical protein